MKDFSYYCPVRMVFGNGTLNTLPELVGSVKHIMIVTGLSSAQKSGLLARITKLLKDNGIETVLHAAAEENPSVMTVEKAAEQAQAGSVELVIGLGGGSAMDAAKAIAVKATNSTPLRDLFAVHEFPEPALPIICIPTTAGTGSEMNAYSIITDKAINDKKNLNGDATFPKYAILDPELTLNLPQKITVDTGVDALSHAIEGFIARRAIPIADCLALEAIRLIRMYLPLAYEDEQNLEARGQLLYASALAGIILIHTGTTALHALGYRLTLEYGVAHGRANAALLPHYLKSVEHLAPDKLRRVYEIFEHHSKHTGSEAMFEFIENLDVETALSAYGVDNDALSGYCEYVAARGSTQNTPGTYAKAELDELLVKALNKS